MFTFSHLSPLFRRLRHSHEIYADEMERVGRGLALWNPQPVNRPQDSAHSDPPVAIGDVGYCRDGKWHHLFNIHREAGEQRGSPHLPDGFECVPLQDRDLETEYRGPQQFSSASSSSFSVGVGGEHSLLNVQGPSCHISFQSSSSLVYFGQSTHLSTPRVDLYTAYAVRHLSNWENLTRRLQNDGYRLTVKELLLVYECTLAPIWITSTALSRTVDAHLGATVQAVPVGGSVSLAVSFTNTGRGTDYMYGPYSRFNASLYPPTPIEPTLATLDHIAYPADQCLFVKGVHINRLSASDKRKHRRRDGKSRPGEDGYVSGERKSETKDGQLGGGRLRNPSQAEASDGEENRSPRTEDLDRSHEYASESESEDSNWASGTGVSSNVKVAGGQIHEDIIDDTNLSLLHDENYLPGVSNEKQATDARTRILEYLLDSNYSKADVAVVRDHDLQPYLEYIEDGVDLSNVLTQALPRVFEYPTTAGLLGSLSELDFEEFQPRSSVEKAALAKTLSEDNVSRSSMDNTESTSKAESSPTRKGFTPSGLSQNMRDKVKQTLERISRRLTKRAYRLDVDLYQAQAWTPYLLQGRYSTPQVYTRWPFDGRATLDPEVETLQTVSIAEDELTSLASTLSVSSLGDRISLEQPAVDELLAEDRAPYTPFNRRHTYPLVSRGKEVATLTILSRAHRAEARPLLCDGDYITGLVTIPGDEISRIRGIEVVFRKFNPGQTTPASEIRSNMTPQDILKDSKSASFKDGVFDWTFELSTLSSITIAQSAELSKSSRPLSPQAAPHWDGYCELSVIVTRRPRLNRNVAFTKVIKFIPPLTTPPPSPTHREFGLARRQSSLWEEQRSTLVSLRGVFFGNNVEFDCAVVTPVTFPARLRSAIPLKLQLSSTNAYAIQTLTRSPSAILDVRLFKVIAHGSEPMSDLIKGVSIWKPRSFHQTKELGSVVWQANDGIALGYPIITRSRVNDRHTVQLQGDFHIIRGLEHEIQRSVQFRDFAVMFIVVLFPLKMGDGFEPANGMPHGKELVLSQIEIQANA